MILESELHEYTGHYEFMFDNFYFIFPKCGNFEKCLNFKYSCNYEYCPEQ